MYSHTTCHVKHAHKERYIWRKIRKGNSIKAIKFVIGNMRVLLIGNFLEKFDIIYISHSWY